MHRKKIRRTLWKSMNFPCDNIIYRYFIVPTLFSDVNENFCTCMRNLVFLHRNIICHINKFTTNRDNQDARVNSGKGSWFFREFSSWHNNLFNICINTFLSYSNEIALFLSFTAFNFYRVASQHNCLPKLIP